MGGNKMLIGITGGIGAGKSIVARILRTMGYPVYDCDYMARCIMNESEEVCNALRDKFGATLYVSGRLDRKMLAQIIFADKNSLKFVNGIVHRAVRQDMLDMAMSDAGNLFFVESAIMASSGLAEQCDLIWKVDAPEALRRQRALKRGGITEADLDNRINVQREEFKLLDDYRYVIIDNEKPLLPQIDYHLKALLGNCRVS